MEERKDWFLIILLLCLSRTNEDFSPLAGAGVGVEESLRDFHVFLYICQSVQLSLAPGNIFGIPFF